MKSWGHEGIRHANGAVLYNVRSKTCVEPLLSGHQWGRRSFIVSEVSLFQRLKCMQEWYILGVGKAALFREVPSVQWCPYRRVPLYYCDVCTYSIDTTVLN